MSKAPALLIGGSDPIRALLRAEFELLEEADLGGYAGEIPHLLWQGHAGCDGALMDRIPGLRIISNYGVGYDSVDVAAAQARGITVSHTRDVLNDETANTAVLLVLMVAREALAHVDYLKSGRWAQEGEAPLSRSVRGLKAGILGLGRIGKAAAEKLEGFGVEIGYHGRSAQDVPYRYYPTLLEMARDVDILVSVAPGGAATQHLINAEVIAALGPRGILVNIGRGSVVDEAAMIAALERGEIWGVGLDVFEHEPQVPQALINHPRATLFPHIGSATVETRAAMDKLAVDNLVAFRDTGAPLTPIPECM